jgi:hypothetical protein
MRALPIVMLQERLNHFPSLLEGPRAVELQTLVPQRAMKSFDKCVFIRPMRRTDVGLDP